MSGPDTGDGGARRARRIHALRLELSSGVVAEVRERALLGRRPMPEPAEPVDQLVVLTDPGRTVSKTHLEFGVENGRAWVADRFSANGTVLVSPVGVAERLEPGVRYDLVIGARIEVGDHYIDVR